MQRQRFITTIKSVIGGKKKKKTQGLIDFIVPLKSTTTVEVGSSEGKKKIQKTLHNKSEYKTNKFFLSHCCQSPLPHWESQPTSLPQDTLQHCAGLWTCSGVSSDSNLVLLLCILASNVHSYQSQCVFFVCVRALSLLLYIPQTQSLPS